MAPPACHSLQHPLVFADTQTPHPTQPALFLIMYELPLPTPSPTLRPLLGATHLEQTMRLYSSNKVAELMIFHIFCWGLDKVEVAAFVAYLAIITQGLTQTLFPREPFSNLKPLPRGDKGGDWEQLEHTIWCEAFLVLISL